MYSTNNGLKQVGVLGSGGPQDQAPVKKLTHVAEAKMYAVRYGDENGMAHTVMLVKAGNQWYMPPNAEQWSAALKPIAPWLSKQLEEGTAKILEAEAQKKDSVDVLGSGG